MREKRNKTICIWVKTIYRVGQLQCLQWQLTGKRETQVALIDRLVKQEVRRVESEIKAIANAAPASACQ
jgi:hypothetical protein